MLEIEISSYTQCAALDRNRANVSGDVNGSSSSSILGENQHSSLGFNAATSVYIG